MAHPDHNTLIQAWHCACLARAMSDLFEREAKTCSRYVHATSKGHESIQIAAGLQLTKDDFAAPYYRDDAMLIAMGCTPKALMTQLLAKSGDPFSGGRSYYSHPSLKDEDKPKIPHQSSATGMQAIPATGLAMGLRYKTIHGLEDHPGSIVLCSLGDACTTEGEVSEAYQMAVLKKLPILFLVQDNGWDISASSDEYRAQDPSEYAAGFKGMNIITVNGSSFVNSWQAVQKSLKILRDNKGPVLLHASVPLLNHHTSGVRMEWYRDDLEDHTQRDPLPILKKETLSAGVSGQELSRISEDAASTVEQAYQSALSEKDPEPETLMQHCYAPTTVVEEEGVREPEGASTVVMVDAALHGIAELMEKHPECLLYGQDVGARLGGVFREAATLADRFGNERVFNTPIQEAFIIGSTVGMSAAGLKPIVEVQFADYIWPGLNQLFTELSRSYYLSNGKWPVHVIVRVPTGCYGRGGPYHSSSIESIVTNIIGIKVVYPSNGADLKGLIKAAYLDPNPVVLLEHKGLYWSKVPGTEGAKTPEPDAAYVYPIGKGRVVLTVDEEHIQSGLSMCIVTYGMGVYWAQRAAKSFPGQVEILDLISLAPLDEELIFTTAKRHGKCLVLTEEPSQMSFAHKIANLISINCFEYLDTAVRVIGSANTPAVPLNAGLEDAYLPDPDEITNGIRSLLND